MSQLLVTDKNYDPFHSYIRLIKCLTTFLDPLILGGSRGD